jgi:hypothetical protein
MIPKKAPTTIPPNFTSLLYSSKILPSSLLSFFNLIYFPLLLQIAFFATAATGYLPITQLKNKSLGIIAFNQACVQHRLR